MHVFFGQWLNEEATIFRHYRKRIPGALENIDIGFASCGNATSDSYSCSVGDVFIVELDASRAEIDQRTFDRIFLVIVDKCEGTPNDLSKQKSNVHVIDQHSFPQFRTRTTNFFTQPVPFSSKKFKYPRRETTGEMRTSSIEVMYFSAMPDMFIRLSMDRDLGMLGEIEPVMLPSCWKEEMEYDGSKWVNLSEERWMPFKFVASRLPRKVRTARRRFDERIDHMRRVDQWLRAKRVCRRRFQQGIDRAEVFGRQSIRGDLCSRDGISRSFHSD